MEYFLRRGNTCLGLGRILKETHDFGGLETGGHFVDPQCLPDSTCFQSCRLLFFPEASMAEDWQDCPALGPGWKRRESLRKSGASCGRSDIYYRR